MNNWLALVQREVTMRGMTSAWSLRDRVEYHKLAKKLLTLNLSSLYIAVIRTHLAANPLIIRGGRDSVPTGPKPPTNAA